MVKQAQQPKLFQRLRGAVAHGGAVAHMQHDWQSPTCDGRGAWESLHFHLHVRRPFENSTGLATYTEQGLGLHSSYEYMLSITLRT